MSRPHPLERAVGAAFPWLLAGLVASVPLLLIPPGADRRWDVSIHLSVLAIFSLALAWRLPVSEPSSWFSTRPWSPSQRFLAAAVAKVVIVTGVTALVTLASSAALRYQPSLQFLQLLSALDIAWVVSGTALAARSLWGRRIGMAAGVVMAVLCVLSIVLYLVSVGLAPDDGWLLDGGELLRLVIPSDVVAAIITVGLLLVAARRSANRAGESPVV